MSGEKSKLYVGSDLLPEEAIRVFLATVDSHKLWDVEPEALNEAKTNLYAFAETPYFHIEARNISLPTRRDSYKSSLGFSAHVIVIFGIYLEEPKTFEEAIQLTEDFLLKHVLLMAEKTTHNLALVLRESDWLALRKVDNQLFLNFKHPIWTPERLAWVKMPYIAENAD